MKNKPDNKNRFVIIMAGGRGERFWPVSREKTPKQLLTLFGKKSFLQEAVDRVLPLVPAKNIFVITNAAQLPEVRKQLPKIPAANLVAEPISEEPACPSERNVISQLRTRTHIISDNSAPPYVSGRITRMLA